MQVGLTSRLRAFSAGFDRPNGHDLPVPYAEQLVGKVYRGTDVVWDKAQLVPDRRIAPRRQADHAVLLVHCFEVPREVHGPPVTQQPGHHSRRNVAGEGLGAPVDGGPLRQGTADNRTQNGDRDLVWSARSPGSHQPIAKNISAGADLGYSWDGCGRARRWGRASCDRSNRQPGRPQSLRELNQQVALLASEF